MEANGIEPRENVLRKTPGLTDINSFIGRGQGFVNLTFAVGTDLQTAKLDVINNLIQAPPRPLGAIEIFATDVSFEARIRALVPTADALVPRNDGSYVFRLEHGSS